LLSRSVSQRVKVRFSVPKTFPARIPQKQDKFPAREHATNSWYIRFSENGGENRHRSPAFDHGRARLFIRCLSTARQSWQATMLTPIAFADHRHAGPCLSSPSPTKAKADGILFSSSLSLLDYLPGTGGAFLAPAQCKASCRSAKARISTLLPSRIV